MWMPKLVEEGSIGYTQCC